MASSGFRKRPPGIHTSDKSKHIFNICSVSILKKNLLAGVSTFENVCGCPTYVRWGPMSAARPM